MAQKDKLNSIRPTYKQLKDIALPDVFLELSMYKISFGGYDRTVSRCQCIRDILWGDNGFMCA